MGFFDRLFSESVPFDPMEAERLAKLMLAELVLYETRKLEEGRANRNIYASLGPEIEAVRKRFTDRYPQPEAVEVFDRQLVAILANGDRSKLGAPISGT